MASIDDSITQAMRDGKFDNLSGQGKPLRLDEHPHEDPEWRLAHHVLKENGFTLPWIELRQEIEADAAAAGATLQRAWESCRAAGDRSVGEAHWQRAQSEYIRLVEHINHRIRDYNIQTPALTFQLPILNAPWPSQERGVPAKSK